MGKLTTPSPPPVLAKRQHSGRNALRLSTKPDSLSLVGGDGSSHDAMGTSDRSPEKDAAYGSTPLSSPISQSSSLKNDANSSSATEHRIDRSVDSRTQFQIALPLPGSCGSMSNAAGSDVEASADQRGWSSPHGEPYRPLSKPDLNLKFSPRLANGSNLLQNAHRMKVFEGKDEKEKAKGASEVRHANAVGTAPGASSPALQATRPGLFEMFPLNFANKKRSLDERQVKLAYRLHASMNHYSPEKVRGLRRNNVHQHQLQQRELALLDATEPHSVQGGAGGGAAGADAPVDLLRRAIHECSSRLRSVKNGAGFLTQVPSSEHLDLLVLQEKYRRERAHYALSAPNPHHNHVGSTTTRAGTRGLLRTASVRLHNDEDAPFDASDHWDFDTSSSSTIDTQTVTASGGGDGIEGDDLYLPYTTRRPQKSPNKRHPTLSEFKSRVREEKMPRPLLSMQNPCSTPENGSAPSSALSTTRSSIRADGSILATGLGTPVSPSPPRASSVAATTTMNTPLSSSSQTYNECSQIGSASNELTSLSLRTGKHHSNLKSQAQQQKKLHSVERLQAAVDAIQDAKRTHSELLGRTVESLNQDRRDCLAVKFRHFNVQRHLDDDIYQMCHASELHRVETIDNTIDQSAGWYRDLLKQLLAREAPLHPAESFFVGAIRQISNEGHAFEKELFFRLILLLHRDDLYIQEVQQMLAFLRQALGVTLEEWEVFFNANALPEPAEIYERKEIKQEKKQHRLAKLRAIVTLNQAIHHFSRSGERSR